MLQNEFIKRFNTIMYKYNNRLYCIGEFFASHISRAAQLRIKWAFRSGNINFNQTYHILGTRHVQNTEILNEQAQKSFSAHATRGV